MDIVPALRGIGNHGLAKGEARVDQTQKAVLHEDAKLSAIRPVQIEGAGPVVKGHIEEPVESLIFVLIDQWVEERTGRTRTTIDSRQRIAAGTLSNRHCRWHQQSHFPCATHLAPH